MKRLFCCFIFSVRHNENNKTSTDMKKQILELMYNLEQGNINYKYASKQVLDLFSVSGSTLTAKEAAIDRLDDRQNDWRNEPKSSVRALHLVTCPSEFKAGIELFENYKSVNVLIELKDEFNKALSEHFMEIGGSEWSSHLTPYRLYWNFKRT
jgi:hypothetical protein